MLHHSWKIFIGCLSRTGFISKYFCLCLSVSITLVHLILLQCSLFILLLASAYDLQKTPPGFRNTKCILELSYLLLTNHFTSLHRNCGTFSLLHFVHLVLWLCLRNNWNLIFSHIDLFFVYNCFELLVCILCIITNRCDLDGMAVYKSLLYVCIKHLLFKLSTCKCLVFLVGCFRGICHSDQEILRKIQDLLPALVQGYQTICNMQSRDFFGLRDYYR